MNNNQLENLVKNINLIHSTLQFEYIAKCKEILNFEIYNFEIEEIERLSIWNTDIKDICTQKIIEKSESILTNEQLSYFYKNLDNFYIKYTNNEELILNSIIELENNGKFLNRDNTINSFAIDLLVAINNDEVKFNYFLKYQTNLELDEQCKILSSFNDDNIKLSYINLFVNKKRLLSKYILSFKSDEVKINLYDQYSSLLEDYIDFPTLLVYLNDDRLKLEYLMTHECNSRKIMITKLLYSLDTDKSLETAWPLLDVEGKLIVLAKFKDENKKMLYLKLINDSISSNDYDKGIMSEIILTLSDENIKKVANEYLNINFSILEIFDRIEESDFILNMLSKRGNKGVAKFVRKEKKLNSQVIFDNLDLFLKKEQVDNPEEVKKYIQEMYLVNNDIVHTIEWEILSLKYIQTLGLEKINILGSFENITKKILSLNDTEYKIFYKCFNHYLKKFSNVDWQKVADKMLDEIYINRKSHKNYIQFIYDIEKVDLDKLIYILLNGHMCDINSLEDINNYDKLIEAKCNRIIEEGSLDEIKDAIFIKYYGLSDRNTTMLQAFRDQAKDGILGIYSKYYYDINLIENQKIKDIFNFISFIINCDSKEILQRIYRKKTHFTYSIDTYQFESEIKNEFLKLYNKDLLQITNLQKNEKGLYEAGVEFSIIATSVGAYVKNSPDNFKDDWNRPSLASPHFCTNFIRNDMLGTAPIPHFMYGFCSMEPYSLVLSGSNDIHSSGASLVSKAEHVLEKYYAPNNQINNTAFNKEYKFNEMDFKRIQNGQKKQPDYILVFRKNGIIDNLEEAKKASIQWDNLPIVVVDVDLCIRNERKKVGDLLYNFYSNPSEELLNCITTKIYNNRITDSTFANDIDIEKLKEYLSADILEHQKNL